MEDLSYAKIKGASITQQECAKCPNREFLDTESRCTFKCDDGKVRTGNSECIDIPHGWTASLWPTSCSMAEGIYAGGCLICDDGEQGAVKNNTPGCYPCSDTGPFDYVFSTKWCH